ncbi:hypothetical protein PROFUN_11082 [Planoprotostelium fungivorum]|uniref:Transmembrane protein n=1 Tax=Planoprotostelium fungivorum TaxID=1890364 RepID=A0A2P6NAH9_9EUKA|nr:hypothetical protein PROFUN_11082 [Planoprotostelium fungivorum]
MTLVWTTQSRARRRRSVSGAARKTFASGSENRDLTRIRKALRPEFAEKGEEPSTENYNTEPPYMTMCLSPLHLVLPLFIIVGLYSRDINEHA